MELCGPSKMELEGRSKNGTQKCEDEIKGIQKWSRKFRDILVPVPNILPHPFFAKDVVVKLTGKVENALRSKILFRRMSVNGSLKMFWETCECMVMPLPL